MSEWQETEIGRIPKDWKLVQFGSLLEQPLRNGVNKPSRIRGSGYKMVNMNEIFAIDRMGNIPMELVPLTNAEKKTSLLQKYDLLFARQSLVFEGAGKCSIFLSYEKDVCFEGHLIRARINKRKANPLFYYYFFSSNRGKLFIRTIVEQAVVAGIRGSDLKKLTVPYPPKIEQDTIATLADILDTKIDLLRRQNTTLEAIAQTLFKHWFVDFEFPDEQGRPYKSAGGPMQASELGEIPVGWRGGTLGEISTFRNGKTSPDRDDSKLFPVYGSNGIIGKADNYNTESIIVIGRVGSYCGSLYYSLTKCWVTDNAMFGWLSFSDSQSFLYHFLKRSNLNKRSTGSGQPLLNQSILESIELTIPDKTLVICFEQITSTFYRKIAQNEVQIRTLTRLRDTLLPKLMSGQLRVEAERVV